MAMSWILLAGEPPTRGYSLWRLLVPGGRRGGEVTGSVGGRRPWACAGESVAVHVRALLFPL